MSPSDALLAPAGPFWFIGPAIASHYIERIGDRVTNIAEDVVFLASGEIEDLNP
jgi:phosphate uptake regulator